MRFIGRQRELFILKEFLVSNDRKLVSIIGRRGVGKSRLNDEFIKRYIKNNNLISLIQFKGGKGLTKKQQIKNCLTALLKDNPNLNLKEHITDWQEFFLFLLNQFEDNRYLDKKIVLVIDEFAWLHNKGSGFVDAFAYFYDQLFNKNILIIITGSAISWMNKNVLKTSGGLHGKTHKTINLKPFDLLETKEYLDSLFGREQRSPVDYINYYFYTGGVARYLEKVNPSRNLLENVHSIYDNGNNAGNSEFEELFYSIFEGKSKIHKDILFEFKNGNAKTKIELSKKLKFSYNAISDAVDDLVVSNILSCKQNYGKTKKEQVYFLTDLFCYFYIKLFDRNVINYLLLDNCAVKGLAFEILVLLNIDLIKKAIGRSGFITKEYSWFNNKAQVDLILDYGKDKFSLIEVKYYNKIFDVDGNIVDNILNKKDEFLNSIKRVNKEMDIIFISLLGTNHKDNRIHYIDVNISEILKNHTFINNQI